MRTIKDSYAEKAGIKMGINPSTVGLEKITEDQIQKELEKPSGKDTRA